MPYQLPDLLVVCGTVPVRGVGHAISTKEDWGHKCHLCGKLGEKKLKCCSWQDKTEKPQKSTPFTSPAPENRLMYFLRLRGTCSSSVPSGKGTLYWDCCKADVQGHIMSCVCNCRNLFLSGLPPWLAYFSLAYTYKTVTSEGTNLRGYEVG